MIGWVAKAVAYRNAKRAGGAEVSSTDNTVADKQTVEAAVKAGEVDGAEKPVDGVNGSPASEPTPNTDGIDPKPADT